MAINQTRIDPSTQGEAKDNYTVGRNSERVKGRVAIVGHAAEVL